MQEVSFLKRASSIIYLGTKCSYASKPGNLFRTAYVSTSMWLFSWARWQTRSPQGQFFERKYSRQSRWPFLAAVPHVPSCTSHPFSTQYFNMSRLPSHTALPLVWDFKAHSFSSRAHRSNLRSFVPATCQQKTSWFIVSPSGKHALTPHGNPSHANSIVDIEDNSRTQNISSNSIFALITALRLALQHS